MKTIIEGQGGRNWLSPDEVAELIGATREQVLDLVRKGRIPAVRLSRKLVRISRARLVSVLEGNPAGRGQVISDAA